MSVRATAAVIGVALVALAIGGFILGSRDDPSCPPRMVSQIYRDTSDEGRDAELFLCGERARPFAFVGDAVLFAAAVSLVVAGWATVAQQRRRSGRPVRR